MSNNKLNEAIKTIKELCKVKGRGLCLYCTECPMNWNCSRDPAFWEEVNDGAE